MLSVVGFIVGFFLIAAGHPWQQALYCVIAGAMMDVALDLVDD